MNIKITSKLTRTSLLLVVLCSLAASGCSSVQYHAEKLPDTLRIAPRGNPQTVDLSRLASAPVSNEIISRSDVLEVTISAGLGDDDTVTHPVRVNGNGTANLPSIGQIRLSGLGLDGAEAVITSTSIQRGIYKAPLITVTMKEPHYYEVTMLGAVNKQGVVKLRPNSSDLLSAIVAAEGLADDAGEHVEINAPNDEAQKEAAAIAAINSQSNSAGGYSIPASYSVTPATQSQPTRINLVSAAKKGDGGVRLSDGAVVMVEKRAPAPIQVIGLVKKPGSHDYPIGQDFRVLGAISAAGGLSSPVANKVFVIRPVEGKTDPTVIQVSIRKAKKSGRSNLRLAPGDVVSVEQTPPTMLLEVIQIIRFGIGASLGTAL